MELLGSRQIAHRKIDGEDVPGGKFCTSVIIMLSLPLALARAQGLPNRWSGDLIEVPMLNPLASDLLNVAGDTRARYRAQARGEQ